MQYPNWFNHYAVRYFERHLSPLAGRPGLRFLQIGAFTGDASIWLLDNILAGEGSQLFDVDTWEGSDEPEHDAFDWREVEDTYDLRTAGRTAKFRGRSAAYFRARPEDGPWDFAYIDGDHSAATVLEDAQAAFRAMKPGGIIAFDDYLWKPSGGGGPTEAPGIAVDAFAAVYADRLQVLETGLQVWLRKTS